MTYILFFFSTIDISLSIRGCKNLVESFYNFIKTKYCNIITSRHGVQVSFILIIMIINNKLIIL